MKQQNDLNKNLLDKGYIKIDSLLDKDFIEALNDKTTSLLNNLTEVEKAKGGNQGIRVRLQNQFPELVELIANEKLTNTFSEIGLSDVKYWSGYIIAKQPHSIRSYWHQDWPFWNSSLSYEEQPQQLFIMVYLDDIDQSNGCLKLIPSSHRNFNPIHKFVDTGHDHNSIRYDEKSNSMLYEASPQEISIEIKKGDVVIGDSRILHCAEANSTSSTRNLIILWYLPFYNSLPNSIKKSYNENQHFPLPSDTGQREIIESLRIDRELFSEVKSEQWERKPNLFKLLNNPNTSNIDFKTYQPLTLLLDKVHRQEEDKVIELDGILLKTSPSVFSPLLTKTSKFFSDNIELVEKTSLLEVGTGSGYNLIKLSKKYRCSATVGLDINKDAVRLATSNLSLNNVYGQIIESDLFNAIGEMKFDNIIFNPPLLLGNPESTIEKAVLDKGGKTIKKFFKEVNNFLQPKGSIFLIYTDYHYEWGSAKDFIEELITLNGFQFQITSVKDVVYEKYTVYKLAKNERH